MAGGLMAGPRSGRRMKSRYRANAEINVTPFVDVMLVLLIVFMVTAPLLTVGVPVDLPRTKAASLNDADEPLVVSINGQGQLYLMETEVTREELVPKLVAITGNNPDLRIFVRGDREIAYGQVMEIMGAIAEAGFSRVALLARLPETGGTGNR